jgi:hypothetical protein
MNKKTLVAFLPAIVLLAFWTAGTFVVGQQVPAPKAAAATFDHSNCQYPDRWTNPAEGCDNSDPAVPECIKSFSTEAGEKACIDAFVKANNPQAPAPITSDQTPANNATPTGAAPVSSCTGK